jgi:hypothetical protein
MFIHALPKTRQEGSGSAGLRHHTLQLLTVEKVGSVVGSHLIGLTIQSE